MGGDKSQLVGVSGIAERDPGPGRGRVYRHICSAARRTSETGSSDAANVSISLSTDLSLHAC